MDMKSQGLQAREPKLRSSSLNTLIVEIHSLLSSCSTLKQSIQRWQTLLTFLTRTLLMSSNALHPVSWSRVMALKSKKPMLSKNLQKVGNYLTSLHLAHLVKELPDTTLGSCWKDWTIFTKMVLLIEILNLKTYC